MKKVISLLMISVIGSVLVLSGCNANDHHHHNGMEKMETLMAEADLLQEGTLYDLQNVSLVHHAMWELIQEHAGLSEQLLLEKIEAVDLRDGRLDGKLRARAQECSE